MVEYQSPQLDAVFHALSDATRRAMLSRLTQGESSIGQLAAPFDMSFAGASKHIKVLENAGLVRREIRGRSHICRLEAGHLKRAQNWIAHYEKFWTTRLDALESALRATDEGKEGQ